jgi:regulator-associated protein of mTOR
LDLVKDNGHNYFINVLSSSGAVDPEQKIMSAFILSVIANNCRPGQSACLTGNLLQVCLAQLSETDPLLRRWAILCMAKLWESFEDAKWVAVRESAPDKLCTLLNDSVPEVRFFYIKTNFQVRAAAVYALGTFIGGGEGNDQRMNIEMNLGLRLMVVTGDVSSIVRKELIVSLSRLVRCYERKFKDTVAELINEDKNSSRKLLRSSKSREEIIPPNSNTNDGSGSGSIYGVLWKVKLVPTCNLIYVDLVIFIG